MKKPEITILNPFYFEMKFLEFDDHLPSLNIRINIKANDVYYDGDNWFLRDSLDQFINKLEKKENIAILMDLEKTTLLELSGENNEFTLKFESLKENKFRGQITLFRIAQSSIRADIYDLIVEKFKNIDRWW